MQNWRIAGFCFLCGKKRYLTNYMKLLRYSFWRRLGSLHKHFVRTFAVRTPDRRREQGVLGEVCAIVQLDVKRGGGLLFESQASNAQQLEKWDKQTNLVLISFAVVRTLTVVLTQEWQLPRALCFVPLIELAFVAVDECQGLRWMQRLKISERRCPLVRFERCMTEKWAWKRSNEWAHVNTRKDVKGRITNKHLIIATYTVYCIRAKDKPCNALPTYFRPHNHGTTQSEERCNWSKTYKSSFLDGGDLAKGYARTLSPEKLDPHGESGLFRRCRVVNLFAIHNWGTTSIGWWPIRDCQANCASASHSAFQRNSSGTETCVTSPFVCSRRL